MLDANFRLKLKDRNFVDPPLGPGLAYYVESSGYMQHVEASGVQTEASKPCPVEASIDLSVLLNR